MSSPPKSAQWHSLSFDIHMKWKFGYSIFVSHIQFFLHSLEFQENQENIHPILLILKVVIALPLSELQSANEKLSIT